jgi:hypothetical protein
MVLFRLIYHNHVYTCSLFIPMAYSLVICTISIELMVYIQLTYNKLLLGYPVVLKVVVLYKFILLVLHSKNSAIE